MAPALVQLPEDQRPRDRRRTDSGLLCLSHESLILLGVQSDGQHLRAVTSGSADFRFDARGGVPFRSACSAPLRSNLMSLWLLLPIKPLVTAARRLHPFTSYSRPLSMSVIVVRMPIAESDQPIVRTPRPELLAGSDAITRRSGSASASLANQRRIRVLPACSRRDESRLGQLPRRATALPRRWSASRGGSRRRWCLSGSTAARLPERRPWRPANEPRMRKRENDTGVITHV